jgi:DHA3 family tetracycline resistance protein-like MFS transporter
LPLDKGQQRGLSPDRGVGRQSDGAVSELGVGDPLRQKMSAFTVYMILQSSSSLFFSLIFTVNLVYHLTVVELSPLQLVLVGTILETTVFIFEIPTGVLADVKSRRLSVIIGCVLIGLGFMVEGSFPFFWTVALAQVLWGFGYTFTSGATQAWIVDEVGEKRAGEAFLRGSQAAQAGDLLAVPISIVLGSMAIALPIVLGGALMILLAAFLALAMPEEGFRPTPVEDRTTLGLMLKTVRDARQVTRRQPVLLALLGVGLFFGLYSEGLDRLWTAHLLQDFAMPWIEVVEPVVWFGLIRAVLLVISLVATEIIQRGVDTNRSAPLARALMWNAGLIVVALAGFGLTGSFWLALALYWLVEVLRSVRAPLYDAWFNQRIDDPQVRATMFSVSSQVDAIGQIGGGPAVGAIGNVSIRAALVVSALILSPALPLYALAIRRGERHATE